MSKLPAVVLIMCIYLAASGLCWAEDVTISAAASLRDSFLEIEAVFEQTYPQTSVHCNFASSGVLRRQIELNAPVDLYASANLKHMEMLVEKDLVDKDSVAIFARNTLLLIVPTKDKETIKGWNDITRAKRIAIGHPDHAPVGMYAKEVLVALGLWKALDTRLVYANHVRQVLEYVAQGMVDAGVVYATDVAIAKGRVKTVAPAPPRASPPILYPVGVVRNAKNREEAELFRNFLLSPAGEAILEKYGFTTIEHTRD